MGTNYYLIDEVRGETLHIGKSSAGWCFGLHVFEEGEICSSGQDQSGPAVRSLSDWEERWSHPGCSIENEYQDGEITIEYMLKTIKRNFSSTLSEKAVLLRSSILSDFSEPEEIEKEFNNSTSLPSNYLSWEVFLDSNYAVLGPKNLLRHRLGGLCIKHGEGAWDLLTGEFS